MSEDVTTYKERKEALEAEQKTLSYKDIKNLMQQRSEFMLELDKLKPQDHNWIDRGQVMSCEGAGHPNHRSYKRV